jgi:hypothetical protein
VNPDYVDAMEKRVVELEEIVKQQGSLINQYKMIVKFEFRVNKDSITLSMNNGSCNHIFAQANRDLMKWEWRIEYGSPFKNQFAKETQTKVVADIRKIREMYDKMGLTDEFNEHRTLLIFLMRVTDTDTVEYDHTVDNVRLY